jgi:Arc/MetJ-type ribon-helix-helix transcriptional regulator
MTTKVHELRPKGADSEKITINLGYVDLGHIDLLVQEGFYSNRTDFIRTAIRNQLDRHNDAVKQSVARHQLTSVCVSTAGKTWRPCKRPARRFISRCSGWR